MPTDKRFLKRLSSHIQDSLGTAEALGRSHIVALNASEAAKGPRVRALRGALGMAAEGQWFICDDNAVRISWDLIPEDVLRYIRYKAVMIAGIEDGRLLDGVKEQILKAVRDGTDYDQFRSEVDRIFDSLGVTPMGNHHLQTVFRTNIFTAYSVGQLEQVRSMPAEFPLWRYNAILDARTRPTHRELNGRIFRVGEGPVPPIDYNCRCTAQYLHSLEVDREGITPEDWQGGGDMVRFDTRGAFETWVKENQNLITPGASEWVQSSI